MMINDYILKAINEVCVFEEEEQISGIVDEVKKKFQTQCEYFCAGGFDSPGYDIACYVITFIDENGKLQGQSVEIESC